MIPVLLFSAACVLSCITSAALYVTCPLSERGEDVAAYLMSAGGLLFLCACVSWVAR